MTGAIGNEYDTVTAGSQKAARGLPNPTGGKPGAGVDPRLTNDAADVDSPLPCALCGTVLWGRPAT
ncbi:hypothetical protein [Mycobacteroides abscessus]|uniref:hypothetical protein n=1 Tax=Mycobacteroides abscessus TaxID=36809 RepID=UPI001F169D91|nr:hypothetical protein [Mycobacteroides abscessus]